MTAVRVETERAGVATPATRAETGRGRDGRTAAIAVAGLAVAVIAPALILAAPGRGVTLPAALLFAALGFGPVVTSWLDAGDAFAQLALTVAISLAGYAVAAALLIWFRAWHPDLILLLAVPSGLFCLRRLIAPPAPPPRPLGALDLDVD
jgi:hypothetical protein